MLFSNFLRVDLFGVLMALAAVIVVYYKWSFQYWKRKNFQYLKPKFPFGNIDNPVTRKENIGVLIQQIYNEMKKKKWKHGGVYLFSSPTYFVVDLEYVKNVMAKDFQYFVDRGIYYNEKDDPISAHLFAIGGPKWRNLRSKLTPTFTSSKMKMMFQTLLDCEKKLRRKMEFECEKKNAVDVKEVLACFTTDIIGSVVFGLECHTFEEENSPFRVYGKKAFVSSAGRSMKFTLATTFPELARALGANAFPRDITKFFMKVVKDTVEYREKNNVTRKDFIQLLIDLKNNKLEDKDGSKHDGTTLTMEELAAQCFVFFVAGFESSSATMTFALYELAKHQDIEKRVREEIETVLAKHDGKITYEAIQEMKYMDQVINETLRKYPPATFLTRKCVKDYKIPDEDVVIEKGTLVVLSVLGIHHDPEYYPDPEKFDPERFNEENKNSRHHFAHIPFGEGPRVCIGMRFGLMQIKVGLTSLLKNYRFTVNRKTKEPLIMQVYSYVLAAQGEIWLDAEKIII